MGISRGVQLALRLWRARIRCDTEQCGQSIPMSSSLSRVHRNKRTKGTSAMKKIVVIGLMLMACVTVQASPWTLGAAGNQDAFSVIGGIRPGADAKTEYRVSLNYYDGLKPDTHQAIGLALGATYDVISEANIPFEFPWGIGKGNLKATGYLGGEVGFLVNVKGKAEYDAVAAGIVGVSVGDQENRLGVELLVPVDSDAAPQLLADMDDIGTVRLIFVHRFK